MARTKTAMEPTKTVDGVAYPKHCWAYTPSDDPKDWYLRLCYDPDDELPDGELVLGCIEALKRATVARSQSRLQTRYLPVAKGRIKAAFLHLFPAIDTPDVLKDAIMPPDETSGRED